MNPRGLAAILVALIFAVVLLGVTTTYSAWVASSNHHNSCARSDLILDTLHDVVALAFTPAPGQTLTARQVADIQAFEVKAFARIDQARC